ncbi:MAG TPA: alpha-L-fucosidase [Sphingomicrobium sp.]|nr:alpha-L-fucosidase [Sphingomicrobium sp.]
MRIAIDRRHFLAAGAAAALATSARSKSNGPVAPSWESLASHYQVPDWFRDAKFGIWAHWGPQCQPEFGDWYARLMYMQGPKPWQQGETPYENHLRRYGHPSRTGFIDIIGQWKAEHWQPSDLLQRYRKAGARYFMAMACHHDNFDLFASRHHQWNSVRLGPGRDILGTWEPLVREAGLKFGISNHSSHAWHWYQPAYGYDAEGPMRGRRYDAYWLRRKHGRGKFWEGLDPQELYTGPYYVPPDGITSTAAMDAWHDKRDGQWIEAAPPGNLAFVEKWSRRQKQIVDDYRPDLVYFDDTGLPLGEAGLDAAAYYYNEALRSRGDLDVVVFAKKLDTLQRRAIVEDVERGWLDEIRAVPWQTDTCIGNWHYDRRLYDNDGYKSAKQVVQRLADVVSKNGNLLLNIPVRGDGTIDEKEERVVDEIARWVARNGEAIFSTRPWRRFGEGPTKPPAGMLNEGEAKPFTAADIRFTTKKDELYAIFMEWPGEESAITSLGSGSLREATVEKVELLGGPPLQFRRDPEALRVMLPAAQGAFTPAIRILGRGLV